MAAKPLNLPARCVALINLHPYASLFLAAILLRLVVALVVRQPGYADAYYYYQVAANWQAGRGLTESTVWNYQVQAAGNFGPTDSGQLDQPAFTYWTPLASLLVIAAFSLFGTSFWAASIPFILCAALLPPLAFWSGRLLFGSQQRRYSWLMALVMLFPGRYFLYWNAPDNFAPFALISLLALAAIYAGLYKHDRWLLAAGALSGLAYLSRSDGILLTLTLVICFLVRRRQLSSPKSSPTDQPVIRPRWRMLAAALLLALLVVSPWLIRNMAQFSTLLPANNAKPLFLRNYQDFFSFELQLGPNYYLAWGWNNILGSKLAALVSNALLMVFQALFLLGPLFLLGLWAARRRPQFGPFMVYSLILYLVMALAYTDIGSRGTLFHSAGGLIPYQAGLALAGLEWLGRGKPRPRAASIMALVATAVTIYFTVAFATPGWNDDYDAALRLNTWFALNAGPKDVIMLGEPLSFNYATGRPAITQASDGINSNLEAAYRYHARWFVLGPERYPGLEDLYRQKKAQGNQVKFKLAAELEDGSQVYEVIKA